ncbi:MAG: hypothetical protein ABI690_11265 [Chloroflexota bacterium]
MSNQSGVAGAEPLKTLAGINFVLELFADHMIIRRTDSLTVILPDMFEEVRIVALKDIAAVYLHEAKYIYSQWLTMFLQLTNHRHITLLYSRADHSQAQVIKNMIDDVISKRQPFPAAMV